MSEISKLNKWQSLIQHANTALLDSLHKYSATQQYIEPPSTFPKTKESLLALQRQVITSAKDNKGLSEITQQDETSEVITFLDPSTFEQNAVIPIKGHTKLLSNADLWEKNICFVIEESDTILDCQGAILSSNDDNLTAITIRTPSHQENGIQNIVVKNCLILGYNHGVIIQQQVLPNERYELLQQGKTTLEQQRQQSPHRIQLENIMVAHTRGSGIFVGDHVQHVTMRGIGMVHAGTVGIYLEFGSGHNHITHSYFNQNGFRSNKPNREAIAIDSSTQNIIEYCQFEKNGAGSIFLYRNCFEHANDPSQSNHFLRTQGSDGNRIQYNLFKNEAVGVWVAARQSRNLKGFECGAYPLLELPFAKFHLDEAERNTIHENLFIATQSGIILEDDNNLITHNKFDEDTQQPITIGSAIRTASSEGVVKNNVVVENSLLEDGTIHPMIKFVGGSEKVTRIEQ